MRDQSASGKDGGVGSGGIPGLAGKLDHLFATVPAATKSGRYSNDAAAQALAERGVIVSGVHLSHLRSGRRDNPSAQLLAALADLLGVPIGYFFDTTVEAEINGELEKLSALKDVRVKRLMLRAQGVSHESMALLEAIPDRIRQLEGLDS